MATKKYQVFEKFVAVPLGNVLGRVYKQLLEAIDC
jgi:hypothetical protein